MNLQQRLVLLKRLGEYILSDHPMWKHAREKACYENSWFIPEFIQFQVNHIATEFLNPEKLHGWISPYNIPEVNPSPRDVGIVMAGNIPLAGFHDFLSTFISGHRQSIKSSSKDTALITHLANRLSEWDAEASEYIQFADLLKGRDAYIATGSNNSGRYFDYYFSKYPHIIRRNRTSVAILDGNETTAELEKLSDDVSLYFGLGCRSITKIFVPLEYDFLPLLESFKRYDYLSEHHKYKNNYDYQLAIMLINKIRYMTNGSILLRESTAPFSAVSQLHYEFYELRTEVEKRLRGNKDIQCVCGHGEIPFGDAQRPSLADYADKADTLQFLLGLMKN